MNGKRVLIIDDSKDISRMITAALGTLDASLQIKAIPSAEEAFLEIAREPIDLLVIDIRLPGISGLDLARKVRSRNPNVKIIQISGINDPHIRDQALAAGANEFFHKPLSMSDFLKAASICLGLQPSEPEPENALRLQSETNTPRLADILTGLRKALNATSVGLINERGHFTMQTGLLPEPSVEATLSSTLMAAISASEKVSRQLGQSSPDLVLTFRGADYHLLAAPVFEGVAIIVLLKPEKASLRMAIALEEMLVAQQQLLNLLRDTHQGPAPQPQRMGEAVPTAAPSVEPAPPPPPVADEAPMRVAEEKSPEPLDELLRVSSKKRLKTDELDAFWEDLAAREGADNPLGSDTLTYDQASRLGLGPKGTDL